MWLFKDINSEQTVIFSNENALDTFIKAYGLRMYDINGEFPQYNIDYVYHESEADPDIETILDIIFN